jgi:hypothetical protein
LNISGDRAISFLRSDCEFDYISTIKLNLKKYKNKWKVISYEEAETVGGDGTSRMQIRRLRRAFPHPSWDSSIKEKGGIGYYKKHPKEYNAKEAPIDFYDYMDGRFDLYNLTLKAINKNVKDGIVLGQVNRDFDGPIPSFLDEKITYLPKMEGTEIILYGRSEIDISYYRARLDDDVRDVIIKRITPINACGKTIYKAELLSPSSKSMLAVPKFPDKIIISFNDGTSRFSCVIQ